MLRILTDILIAAFAAFGITAFLWSVIGGFLFSSKKESGNILIFTDSTEKYEKIQELQAVFIPEATLVLESEDALRSQIESFSESI